MQFGKEMNWRIDKFIFRSHSVDGYERNMTFEFYKRVKNSVPLIHKVSLLVEEENGVGTYWHLKDGCKMEVVVMILWL